MTEFSRLRCGTGQSIWDRRDEGIEMGIYPKGSTMEWQRNSWNLKPEDRHVGEIVIRSGESRFVVGPEND